MSVTQTCVGYISYYYLQAYSDCISSKSTASEVTSFIMLAYSIKGRWWDGSRG